MSDPKLASSARYLDAAAFRAEFRRLLNNLQVGFFKLESLQSYEEPDDASYNAFKRGEMAAALDHLRERISSQREFYRQIVRRGVPLVRVRIVDLPLSEYLHYEFKSYQISARFGERILIAERGEIPDNSDVANTSDFLLFDESAALVHDYDGNGRLRGAWHVTAETDCRAYAHIAKTLIAASVPLGEFERDHGLDH